MDDITQEGWEKLVAAIFGKAVYDDVNQIKTMVERHCEGRYPYKLIKNMLNNEDEYIRDEVRKYVLKEGMRYPSFEIGQRQLAYDNRKKIVVEIIKKIRQASAKVV